jgi:hypothetical protein
VEIGWRTFSISVGFSFTRILLSYRFGECTFPSLLSDRSIISYGRGRKLVATISFASNPFLMKPYLALDFFA